jgi:hypothetical protein
MSKSGKKQKTKDFEKEYTKVMRGFNNAFIPNGNQQPLTSNKDYFVKFSMYKETSSGTTSANTSTT